MMHQREERPTRRGSAWLRWGALESISRKGRKMETQRRKDTARTRALLRRLVGCWCPALRLPVLIPTPAVRVCKPVLGLLLQGTLSCSALISNGPRTEIRQSLMATQSSVLAWRIPGTGEPGRLLSMGSVAQSRTPQKRFSSSSPARFPTGAERPLRPQAKDQPRMMVKTGTPVTGHLAHG